MIVKLKSVVCNGSIDPLGFLTSVLAWSCDVSFDGINSYLAGYWDSSVIWIDDVYGWLINKFPRSTSGFSIRTTGHMQLAVIGMIAKLFPNFEMSKWISTL